MKLSKIGFILIIMMQSLFALEYDFVTNGKGSDSTSSQRIYEWENFERGTWSCFHAAGATAINIRLGEKKLHEKSVWDYFKSSIGNSTGSATNWLYSSNKYHIQSLKITKEPASGVFKTKEDLWNSITKNVKNNKPMLIPLKKYSPIYKENTGFKEVSYYDGDVGHAVTAVGYLSYDGNKLIALRDPALRYSEIESRYPQYFDYTISLELLFDTYLQNSPILVFGTDKTSSLKDSKNRSIAFTQDTKITKIDKFATKYKSYFGAKKGNSYISGAYTIQDFTNGRRVLMINATSELYYYDGVKWNHVLWSWE
jgi:hypothetical protein